MKIARGFNRGLKIPTDQAPQGRQKSEEIFLSSLRDFAVLIPRTRR
jgi:hypothetical protein